jgi:hypothetical protein
MQAAIVAKLLTRNARPGFGRDGRDLALVAAIVLSIAAMIALLLGAFLFGTAIRPGGIGLWAPWRALAGAVLLTFALVEGFYAAMAWLTFRRCRERHRRRDALAHPGAASAARTSLS